jgi:hypothetical protein
VGKRKVKSILEFTPKVETYSITNPENGEEFEVRIRPLTPAELADLNATIKRPKPKEIGFKGKDQWGHPIPVFDEESPEYVRALAKANQDFVYAWLIASWEVEIPGETQEEKLESLRKNIPNWVFMELQKKLQEIQGYRASEVAYQKKKWGTTPNDMPSTNSANDAESG